MNKITTHCLRACKSQYALSQITIRFEHQCGISSSLFPAHCNRPQNQWNEHFVSRPFPRSETKECWESRHSRTCLWHDFKRLTACSVMHPAPRWGKTSKVELCSPYFPTKFYTGFLKSACRLLHLCSAKGSWESCLVYFGTTTELLHSHEHNPQGFLSKRRQSYPWHFCTQKLSHTSTHPHHCLITELQNSWGWKAALEIT